MARGRVARAREGSPRGGIFPVSRSVRRLGKVGLRILAGLGGLFVVLIALAVVFRLPLVAWALRHTLTDAGATNVAVTVTELSLRHLEIQPLCCSTISSNSHG